MDLREILSAAISRAGAGPDVYEQVLDRVDLTRFRPKLVSDVEIKSFPLRWGNDYVMVANPRAMLYYRLEPWEAELLPLMDGTRTVGDIIVERMDEEGELDAAGVSQLVQTLELGGFFEPAPVGLEQGLERGLDPLTPSQRKIRIFMKTLSIDWTGADRLRPLVVPHAPQADLPPHRSGGRGAHRDRRVGRASSSSRSLARTRSGHARHRRNH